MIVKLSKYILILCSVSVLAVSCEWEKIEPVDLSDIPEVVSFSEHVVPVFTDNCISCHDGGTPPDLTEQNAYFDLLSGNYLTIETPEQSSFYQKITGNGSMAAYADDYDRAVILRWIEQGAEEN